MKENSLLAMLAKLCGDITITNNNEPQKIFELQQAIAKALINEPQLNISQRFQFEELENFSTAHLNKADLSHLDKVLEGAKTINDFNDNTIRIFKREVPVLSSQLRGSVPEWARGAKVVDTLGPFIDTNGRRFWYDVYRVIPLVQVWLQGALQPFMLLPLQVNNAVRLPRSFNIPKGAVWIHADVFAAAAPDNMYCGLTISGGTITFSSAIQISTNNQVIVPNGVSATVELSLLQPAATPGTDDYGIDAKNASLQLPAQMRFNVSHAGTSITNVSDAKWNLYGQDISFSYDATKPRKWNTAINRISIAFKASETIFQINKCNSKVIQVQNKAGIIESAWLLSAAAININAPLQADGIGAMGIFINDGLEITWPGLKDAALDATSYTTLKNALVMYMPGRINISTAFASNVSGRQRYNLWQTIQKGITQPAQYIDLFFTKNFFLSYDCLAKGTENIAAQTNCINHVNKPVKADGMPFKVESTQTILVLSLSKPLQIAMLYDDNIVQDNWLKTLKNKTPLTNIPVLSFEGEAIALNNALLTVSPVNGMLLYGDLLNEDSFEKCLLIYSFGLLQYLPTLPDPYAANVGFLKRRHARNNMDGSGLTNAKIKKPQYTFADVNAMLVCVLAWKNMQQPSVNFFMGDKPPASVQNTNILLVQPVKISDTYNQQLLIKNDDEILARKINIQSRQWNAVTESEQAGEMLQQETRAMVLAGESVSRGRLSPFVNAFTLLDVSTNADLMGISLGIANDDFIFKKTHSVKEEITGSPITINGMDVQAASRFVQVYTLPQISWEPMISIGEVTNTAQDPFPGILYFLNDGVPAQIANTGVEQVSLAPIPLTQNITKAYNKNNKPLWSYFTLPNGMLALAMYYKEGSGNDPEFQLINEKFKGDLFTGLQIKTIGLKDELNNNRKFYGSAHQLSNINNLSFPATNNRSVLSGSVTEIFNDEFGTIGGFDVNKYVPLERYDFSGYGANIFSHWVNENAALAQTSQAMFDVWRGRTAHEVIQVKSVIYPWGIRVVRTITIYRSSNGFPWRTDSGWKAESDGVYDFRTPIKNVPSDPQALKDAKAAEGARAYVFHPGMVEGVYNVRNIKENTTLAPFTTTWNKNTGVYIDDYGHPAVAPAPQPLEVKLVPVYFDADVKIDDVTQGAVGDKVTSQRMLGYLQLRPRGVFIDAEDFASLLTLMQGLGGPVDCMVNINQSKQAMRITRVEVNPSRDAANNRVFVVAAKGTPVLPKDGSWSVVQHNATTKEVLPLSGNDVIPVIREGERKFDNGKLTYNQDKVTMPVNVAEATELFKALESRAKQFGFLQSTGENKVLFRNPLFEKGKDVLKGSIPDLADAYRLMNSKGIFPKLEDLPKLDELAGDYVMKIKEEGFKLLNKIDPAKMLEQALPPGPWYIVKTNDVKVYVDYNSKDENGNKKDAKLNLDIDSTAKKWLNKMNDVSMVVDLGPFTRLLIIRGKFDTKKGDTPKFIEPVLEFGPQLKPVVDILVLLSEIAINPNYKDILKKGLKVAMSNSPNNWEYKFQADKEIPLLRFPPPNLDTAAAPLRLEANLKAGVYFNVAIPLPPTNGIQAPSAGAFVEFYGKLSVMCLSVGVGTIYAVGQVTVRISADTVIGPALYMKFGFGVEAVVALPVIGSVSVYFAVGVEMSLDSTQITLAGFVLFRGRAEILGGIVTVTIQIEASGKVQQRLGDAQSGQTNMIAQVTFSLDISICFIIDISFTETWQEERQIA
jgi:hypothetical protein